MKSPVSIALFFLLSAFFLATLLGALEHSHKLLAIAAGCLAGVVCIIVFLTPVQLPAFHWGRADDKGDATVSSATSSTTSSTVSTTSTTLGGPVTTGISHVQSR